jgi:hypothetical protein
MESMQKTLNTLETVKTEKQFRRELRRVYSLQYRLENNLKVKA